MLFWAYKQRQCAQNGIVFHFQAGILIFLKPVQSIGIVRIDFLHKKYQTVFNLSAPFSTIAVNPNSLSIFDKTKIRVYHQNRFDIYNLNYY